MHRMRGLLISLLTAFALQITQPRIAYPQSQQTCAEIFAELDEVMDVIEAAAAETCAMPLDEDASFWELLEYGTAFGECIGEYADAVLSNPRTPEQVATAERMRAILKAWSDRNCWDPEPSNPAS